MNLIIQTSIEPFKIALVKNNKLIAQTEIKFPVAASLFTGLEEIIKKTKSKKEEIKEIGFIRGPGSFTGLRTGYAFAQSLARALEIPLKGIGVFEIYANKHSDKNVIAAFKRTRTDAFVAEIKRGKVNFFKTPMTNVNIMKLIDNSQNNLIYGNIFKGIKKKVESNEIDILEADKALQNIKTESFKLIYGNTCYAKTIH